jgi:hypothetical protein
LNNRFSLKCWSTLRVQGHSKTSRRSAFPPPRTSAGQRAAIITSW